MDDSVRTLRLRVKPGSKHGARIEVLTDDPEADLLVVVREKTMDGQANTAVEKAVAHHLGVPKSRVSVVRGHRARIKVVRVDA